MNKKLLSILLCGVLAFGSALPVMAESTAPAADDDMVISIEASADAKTPTSVALTKTAYEYTGKVITPAVTAKDGSKTISKSNYTVKSKTNCKTVGEHQVTVTFKGAYSGSKVLKFKINPKGTTIKSFSAKDNSITVKYNKQAKETTGYEIIYSTSSKGDDSEKVKINSTSTVSKQITGLKPGTKYYFKVRTFKKSGSKYYYSSWSAVKNFKTTGKDPESELKNLSLPYDTISKKVTMNGKELSKYTYNDIKKYLTSYPKAEKVVNTYGDTDVILKSGGKNYLLGSYDDEYETARIYYKGGSYVSVSSSSIGYYKRFSTATNNNGLITDHDYNKKMEVTSYIKTAGSSLFDSLKSGLFKLLSGYKKDSVIPIKGATIKTLGHPENLSPASAGRISIAYPNNKSIGLSSYKTGSRITFYQD